jgi:beta-lactamase superfamily II metal-dependent hydrolase
MRRAVAAALACFALAAAPPPGPGLQVEWVDVEGGAATLIVTPASESVLIDTGWDNPRDAERIREAARRAGVSRIDHLVTTHWHQDHVGGVAALAERMPVGRYYDHGFPAELPDLDPRLKAAYLRATGGRSTVLKPGDTIPLRAAKDAPPLSLRVVSADARVEGEPPGAPQTRACPLQPPHQASPEDRSDNARSIGVVLAFGRFELIDLGDLTRNVEHKLACPKNLAGVVDVYQVTHHGAADSNDPALLQALSPTVAVLDNGARKGGKAEVYHRLQAVPSIQDVFQLHRNVETTAADNAPPAMVANDEEKCQGQPVRLTVDAAARTYTVEVPSKGTRRTYEVK